MNGGLFMINTKIYRKYLDKKYSLDREERCKGLIYQTQRRINNVKNYRFEDAVRWAETGETYRRPKSTARYIKRKLVLLNLELDYVKNHDFEGAYKCGLEYTLEDMIEKITTDRQPAKRTPNRDGFEVKLNNYGFDVRSGARHKIWERQRARGK
jgi:hypothetical protein